MCHVCVCARARVCACVRVCVQQAVDCQSFICPSVLHYIYIYIYLLVRWHAPWPSTHIPTTTRIACSNHPHSLISTYRYMVSIHTAVSIHISIPTHSYLYPPARASARRSPRRGGYLYPRAGGYIRVSIPAGTAGIDTRVSIPAGTRLGAALVERPPHHASRDARSSLYITYNHLQLIHLYICIFSLLAAGNIQLFTINCIFSLLLAGTRLDVVLVEYPPHHVQRVPLHRLPLPRRRPPRRLRGGGGPGAAAGGGVGGDAEEVEEGGGGVADGHVGHEDDEYRARQQVAGGRGLGERERKREIERQKRKEEWDG